MDSCFLFNKKTRTDIAEKAVIALIKAHVFKNSDSFGQEFLQLLFKGVSTSIKKQMSTPTKKVYQEHVEVESSPKKKLKVIMTQKSHFKTSGKKKKKLELL